jgi:hypothetical protein
VSRLRASGNPADAARADALPAPPPADPGDEGRRSALLVVDNARTGVEAEARAVASVLKEAEAGAPEEPDILSEFVSDVAQDFRDTVWRAQEFIGGVWDATVGAIGDTVVAFLEDPLGFIEDTAKNVYEHVAFWDWDTFSDVWVADVKDLIAWDDWVAGRPQRAFGRIAGAAAMGLGVGKLALRLMRRRDGEDDVVTEHHEGGLPDNEGQQGETADSDGLDEEKRREYVADLMKEHKQGNSLTEINAQEALKNGPPGTKPVVVGEGKQGADVLFKDNNGDVVLRREVKTNDGGRSPFDNAVSDGASQVRGNGEIYMQVHGNVDVERWVKGFQGARSDDQLKKYENVRLVVRDNDGNPRGEYNLGERLP